MPRSCPSGRAGRAAWRRCPPGQAGGRARRCRSVTFEVVNVADAFVAADDSLEPRLAVRQRQPPQVRPIEEEKVEGKQRAAGALCPDLTEVGQPVPAMSARLAVDGAVGQRPKRVSDGRELTAPVPAVSAPQANLVAALHGNDAVAVVLDLVNPLRPAGSALREGGVAGLDKARGTLPVAGKRGTQQHGSWNLHN